MIKPSNKLNFIQVDVAPNKIVAKTKPKEIFCNKFINNEMIFTLIYRRCTSSMNAFLYKQNHFRLTKQ